MARSVHQFELFHGIVLTKLVRNPKPITLRMIETNVTAAWALYTINGDVSLLIKSSKRPKDKKKQESHTWQFTFTPDDLAKLRKLKGAIHVALVCGDETVTTDWMQVCLIEANELNKMIDLGASTQQTIRVTYTPPQKKLRVKGTTSADDCLVNRSRLDKWDVPGA